MSEHPLDDIREALELTDQRFGNLRLHEKAYDALRAVEQRFLEHEELRSRASQLEQAAREVVEQDWRELVLDPTWSQRILEPALALFDRKEQTP